MSGPVLEIPFVGGIDESTREEIVEPRSWTTLENIRQNERGGAEKRLGYTGLALTNLDGTSRSAGRALFMNGTQLCCTDGTYLYVWVSSSSRWVNKGRVPEARYQLRELPTLGTDAVCGDTAVKNGLLALLYWTQIGSTVYVYTVVVDATSGAVVLPPNLISSAASASLQTSRLATYGNYIVAFAPVGGGNVAASYLDTSSAATLTTGWVSLGNVITDFSRGFDAVSLTADTSIAVAYGTSSL